MSDLPPSRDTARTELSYNSPIGLTRDNVRIQISRGFVAGVLLLAASLGIFFDSAQYAGSDALGVSVMANNLLTTGSLTPDEKTAKFFQKPDGSYSYQLFRLHGRLEYAFPPGAVIMALPVVMVAKALGLNTLNRKIDRKSQAWLMFAATGVILLVLFDLALAVSTPIPAAVVAAGMFYGTLLGPTMGGAFWSLDGEVAVTAIAVWMLHRRSGARKGALYGAIFGAILFLGFLCRPTFAPLIVCLFSYMAIKERGMLVAAAPVAAGLLALLVMVSFDRYGSYLPPYFSVGRLSLATIPAGLQGLFLSPSRNVFIFSPVLLFPFVFWTKICLVRNPALIFSLVIAMAVYVVVNAAFPMWWGGYSFGPRILANVSFMGCVVTLSILESARGRDRLLGLHLLVGLLALGLFINLPGLLDDNTEKWNEYPIVDTNQAALFDWRFPQFLTLTRTRLRGKCVTQSLHIPIANRAECPN